MSQHLSVIIPTLNEQEHLPATLQSIMAEVPVEVVVADGGSHDDTVSLAQKAGCLTIRTMPGRARQLNGGVTRAHGELLLFLHADTLLPPRYWEYIETTLARDKVALGAFSLTIAGASGGLAAVARVATWRSRYLGLPYGDQALFTTRPRFLAAGGFPEIEIMEDFVFVRRMRRHGAIVTVPAAVITSPRRWRTLGVIRTTMINQIIVIGYLVGVPTGRLVRWYRRLKGVGERG